MTGHTEDAKVAGLLAPLNRLETVPFARSKPQPRPWLRNPALVSVVVAAALVLTGVAIADGLGVFNGLGAAQHPPTSADVPDAQALAGIRQMCTGWPQAVDNSGFYNPYCHLDLSTARFLTDTGPGGKVWVVADARGELCTAGGLWECLQPFGKSRPITFASNNETPTDGGTFHAEGLAMDGVTSVSFVPVPGDGTTVTVPVKGNIWIYSKPNSHAVDGDCVVANFADGSTVSLPEVPCP